MINTLKYKSYLARVEFDSDDCIFTGRIAGIEDGVSFHSDTAKGLVEAFHEAVDDYLETCERIGKAPDKPYSGNVSLRLDPSTHAKLAIAAELSGMSLNQFGAEALERAAEHHLAA